MFVLDLWNPPGSRCLADWVSELFDTCPSSSFARLCWQLHEQEPWAWKQLQVSPCSFMTLHLFPKVGLKNPVDSLEYSFSLVFLKRKWTPDLVNLSFHSEAQTNCRSLAVYCCFVTFLHESPWVAWLYRSWFFCDGSTANYSLHRPMQHQNVTLKKPERLFLNFNLV